jgi:hypothetical protein
MPLPRYLLLHPEAKLSDAEVAYLYQWAQSERKRLKAAAAEEDVRPPAPSNTAVKTENIQTDWRQWRRITAGRAPSLRSERRPRTWAS